MLKKFFGAAALMALAAPLFFAGAVQDAQAQGLKVGYTDHEVIIMNMPEYRTIRQQLQRDVESGQQRLQTMYQDFQEQVERYERQQGLLSPERRAERERELLELQQSIQEQARLSEQQIGEREAELMSPLLDRVQQAIDSVAEALGLDIVLRTQVGMQPVILFVNPRTVTDITMDVARNLGLQVDPDTADRQ
jgi:outer membrane protein